LLISSEVEQCELGYCLKQFYNLRSSHTL